MPGSRDDESRPRPGSHTLRLVRGGSVPALLIAVGTMTANLLGYGFFLVLNRTQDADALGAIVALTNLAVIGAVPALALQLVVARRVAQEQDTSNRAPHTRSTEAATIALRTGLVSAAAMTGLTLALTPAIIWALHLTSAIPALLLSLVIGPTCVSYAVLGLMQGTDRFAMLSILYVVIGLTRLLAGVLAGLVGWGVSGLLAAMAVAAVAAMLIALAVARDMGLSSSLRRGSTWTRSVIHGMTATSALLVVSSLDAPLARHFLPAAVAGEFAVLTIFSKAAFWAPAFIVTVVYSRMATRGGSRHVRLALVATSATVLVGVTLGLLLAHPLALLVGGWRFAHLAPHVGLFVAIGGMWAISQVFVYWRLARGDHRFGLLLWLAAAGIVGTAALATHDTLAALAWTLLAGGAFIGLAGMTLLLIAMRRHRKAHSVPSADEQELDADLDLSVGGLVPTPTDADTHLERHG